MRTYEALTADHPMITKGMRCPGCGELFQVGDIPALVAIRLGTDEEAREHARAGQLYNAVAVPAHAKCAGLI